MDANSVARTIEEILAPRVVTTTISFEHETDGPCWKVEFRSKLKNGQSVGGYIIVSEQLLAKAGESTKLFWVVGQNFKDTFDRLELTAVPSVA